MIAEDLKVVELSSVLAGPLAGSFFSELGAKVIKFENAKSRGDTTRHWKVSSEDENQNVSAYFSAANYRKEYRMVNLDEQADRDQVLAELEDADVCLTNLKKESAGRFGLDSDALHKRFPKLVVGRIRGFESSERLAFDVVLQAETGFMSMNGTENTPPLKMPLALIDVLCAHNLKEALLLALWERERTGKGRVVQASLERSAIASLINQASNWLMARQLPQRNGSLHPNIAPYGETFQTVEGRWIVMAAGSDDQFRRLCEVLELTELAEDERFSTNAHRVRHRFQLQQALRPAISKRSAHDLLAACDEKKVPVAVVKDLEEVFREGIAKDMVLWEEIDGVSTKRVSTLGFKPW